MQADKQTLRDELANVLDAIAQAQQQDIELSATTATVAALMSKSWTIRYQLASLEYDAARKPGPKSVAASMMCRASREAEVWAKRLGIARKGIDDDDIIGADEHDNEQAELADYLKVVAR